MARKGSVRSVFRKGKALLTEAEVERSFPQNVLRRGRRGGDIRKGGDAHREPSPGKSAASSADQRVGGIAEGLRRGRVTSTGHVRASASCHLGAATSAVDLDAEIHALAEDVLVPVDDPHGRHLVEHQVTGPGDLTGGQARPAYLKGHALGQVERGFHAQLADRTKLLVVQLVQKRRGTHEVGIVRAPGIIRVPNSPFCSTDRKLAPARKRPSTPNTQRRR